MEKDLFNASRLIWVLEKASEANAVYSNQKPEGQGKENAEIHGTEI